MAYYRNEDGRFGYVTESYLEVFGEFDFVSDDRECDFFCPECRYILECKRYQETKDEWELLYM